MDFIDRHWEHIIFVFEVLIVWFVVSRIFRLVLGRFLRTATRKLKVDPTRYNFFKNAVDFILFLIAVIVIFKSIPSLRTYGTTLLTGAGVLAAIVGFASQSAFSNIISGIFLVIFRPFSVGDRIRVGQLYTGDVEDITLRHTVIKDFENRRIVIPNSVISNETIINSTLVDEKVTLFIEFTISFDSDMRKAMAIMREVSEAHPQCIDNRTPEEIEKGDTVVMVRTLNVLDLGMQLRAWVWANNPSVGFEMKCDLIQQIKERFDKAGIQVAFPMRALVYKNQPE
ncbi:MAG: mechanosensitive ion channel family protein [Cyclobacteriaceae bacterium]|jgi:small-conductance mechanosensitive channel|nr:mechanosensitive ion channel family protein [Cyclobacteriaceae bacterium]